MELKQKAKMMKLKGEDLYKDVRETLSQLSGIVGSTLGPGGNTVLLERPGLPPLVTKDGVTVIGHVAFQDATKHVISEAAKEVSQRTNQQAGDGTTTAIVLAEGMVRYGLDFLQKNPGKSPQQVCRDLNSMVNQIIDVLSEKALPVKTKEDLFKVAMVSSNFDPEIANAVVEAVDMVGEDGTIVAEEGNTRKTEVQIQEGFPVSKGLNHLGPAQEIFINNEQDQECVFDDPYVMLYDGELRTVQDLGLFFARVLEEMKDSGEVRPILLFAHKFSPQVVKLLSVNAQANTAVIVPVETPSTAQPHSKHHFLHDLASFSGASVFDGVTNTLSGGDLSGLGACGRARVGRYNSYLFDAVDENTVEERITVLKRQKENAESDYDAEIIKERIGNLLGGIATIFVGGSSDLEIKEKKHRIEDSINATRSAIEMGILPGGGATLLCVGQYLRSSTDNSVSEILTKSLVEPFYRISRNAGEMDKHIGDAAAEINSNSQDGIPNLVYDCFKHDFVDPYEVGIVDPVKVTISALSNALSIAQMLMTIGGTIVIPRDRQEEQAAELAAQNFAQQMQGA